MPNLIVFFTRKGYNNVNFLFYHLKVYKYESFVSRCEISCLKLFGELLRCKCLLLKNISTTEGGTRMHTLVIFFTPYRSQVIVFSLPDVIFPLKLFQLVCCHVRSLTNIMNHTNIAHSDKSLSPIY